MAEVVKGVAPGFILLPAREYDWVLEYRVEIRIPNSGLFSDILEEEALKQGLNFGEVDAFEIFDGNYFLFWQAIQVLFARSKYPALEDNQCLNVVAIALEGEEVVLFGEVIRSL